MWVAGIVTVIVVSGVAILPLGWRRRPDLGEPIWDVMRISALYAPICNTLAGFSVASAVFLASLTATRRSDEFAAVMGLLLIAFMAYIGAALVFATIPRVAAVGPGDGGLCSQHIALILGNEALYVAMMVSWLALRPLLLAVELRSLSDVFAWLLLFAVVAGALRLGTLLYRLLGIPLRSYLLIPFLGVGAALLYRGLLVEAMPALWPAATHGDGALGAVLMLGVVSFVVAAGAVVGDSLMLSLHGNARAERRVAAIGHRVMLGYTQMVTTTVGLLWIAIARL